MLIASRSRAILAATLLLMGCQAAPPPSRPIQALRPELNAAAPRQGALRMKLRQQAITPALAARFGLLDVQQLDWDTVRVWLSNERDGDSGRPGFVTRRLTAMGDVDPVTNERTATLIFDDLTPSDGYRLLVRLYRGGQQDKFNTYSGYEVVHDSPEMIASGATNDFDIRSGANTVNVALTLSNGGKFDVDIDEPATTVNQTIGASFTITTQSHYDFTLMGTPTGGDLDTAGGTNAGSDEISGLAIEQDATGTIFFTVPGRNQIFKVEGGVVTLIAGTGTVSADPYATDSGDYKGALDARLSDPRGIVRATTDDHIIFCDTNNSRIRILRPAAYNPYNQDFASNNDLNGSPYRIETLIGGGLATLAAEGDEATDALKVQLASPTALVADENGVLFFTDDDVANSKVRVYRYDGDGTGGDTRLIKEITLDTGAGHGSGEHYGALAIDRLNNLLWVAYGNNKIAVLSDIHATGAATLVGDVDQDNTASWVASSEKIKAITFDQTTARAFSGNSDRWGTLFFSTEGHADGNLVYRMPVSSAGLLPSYREPEPVAGGNKSTLAATRARYLNLITAGVGQLGWGSLLVDLIKSDGTATDTPFLAGTSIGTIYNFNQVDDIVTGAASTVLDDITNP